MFRAGIAPSPAQPAIEQPKALPSNKVGEQLGRLLGCCTECGGPDQCVLDRIGEMGSDNSAGERHIGKVAAIGVKGRVGQVGRPDQRKFLSADARRRATVR